MSALEFHRTTDPACRLHVPPQTIVDRWRYERARGLSCPTCLPDTTSPQPLMRWATPRVPRRAHVAALIVVAALALVAGVLLADALIADDVVCVTIVALWGWTLGCAALAYAHGVIYR